MRKQANSPRYVGPAYQTGIRLNGYSHDIRPAEFTPAERREFLKKHPERASWWATEPPADVPEESA